jgi:hypothetical protein
MTAITVSTSVRVAWWCRVALLATLVTAGWAASAHARTERFALVVGNNIGDDIDLPLRFAESDAARMAEVLQEIGGYRAENVVVARSMDGAGVRRAMISLNERVRRAVSTPGGQAVLLVYYSGHADAEALHLGSSRLDIAELRELVSGSAAQFRVLILDSCRSGALTRVKGGHPAPPFDIRMDSRLAGEGLVFLTSAAANEDAQESDGVGGSVFTHFLLSGLLGAADDDGDGRVSLAEVYRYTYDATVRISSRTLAGAQHPTFQFQLRGQGDLPLTYPGDKRHDRGVVAFPGGRDYLVLRGSAAGRVVAEIAGGEGPRRLSVTPGRYFVRARLGQGLLEGAVDVVAAQTVTVDESRLERIQYARLVRKGTGDRQRALSVAGGYRLRTPLWRGASLCHGGYAGVAVVLPALTIAPRIGFCTGGFENTALEAATHEIDTAVAVQRAWDLGRVTVAVGAEVGTALLIERFTSTRPAPDRTSGAAHAGLEGQLEVPLWSRLHLIVAGGVHTYFFQQQEPAGPRWTASPTLRASLAAGGYF